MKHELNKRVSLQKLAGISEKNKINEIGHQATISSQTLSAMEELKDELAYYLDPSKQYPGMSIDFNKLATLSKNLIIAIKQYR